MWLMVGLGGEPQAVVTLMPMLLFLLPLPVLPVLQAVTWRPWLVSSKRAARCRRCQRARWGLADCWLTLPLLSTATSKLLTPPLRCIPLSPQWLSKPEAAAEFRARLQGSIDYANTSLKGIKHRPQQQQQQQEAGQNLSATGDAGSRLSSMGEARAGEGSEEEQLAAAARAAAAAHTRERYVVEAALRYSLQPEVAAAYARGWEQAAELDRRWGEFSDNVSVAALRCCLDVSPARCFVVYLNPPGRIH